MVLRLSQPPAGSLEVLAGSLSSLRKPSGGAILDQRFKGMVTPEAATQTLYPHAVYVLGLNDLKSGAGNPSARLDAWDYVVDSEAQGPVLAEVTSDEAKGGVSHSFAMLSESPTVERTLQSIRQLEKDESDKDTRFELRMLRVPALNVLALWLKDEDGEDDYFVPVQCPRRLRERQRYAASEWWDLLSQIAKERSVFDDTPREREIEHRTVEEEGSS